MLGIQPIQLQTYLNNVVLFIKRFLRTFLVTSERKIKKSPCRMTNTNSTWEKKEKQIITDKKYVLNQSARLGDRKNKYN